MTDSDGMQYTAEHDKVIVKFDKFDSPFAQSAKQRVLAPAPASGRRYGAERFSLNLPEQEMTKSPNMSL